MREKIVALADKRVLARKKTDLLVRIAQKLFDQLAVPFKNRHQLMFVDLKTYRSWVTGEGCMHARHFDAVVKYIRLYKALQSLCGSKDNAMAWFMSTNNHRLCGGRSPFQTIIEDGEQRLDDLLAYTEHLAYAK